VARLIADVLTTRVADGNAVITLGSTRRIYFDEEMGDALTEALDGFAGDANVSVVVVTVGAPDYSSFYHRCTDPPRRVHTRFRARSTEVDERKVNHG